ncbi:MAG: hypothetical protein ACRD3R_15065, partial [Terriglobales bacterium]
MQFTREITQEMRRAYHAMRLLPESKAGVFDYQSVSPIRKLIWRKQKRAGTPPFFSSRWRLRAVVHVEFDRMGGHAKARDFLHLEVNV